MRLEAGNGILDSLAEHFFNGSKNRCIGPIGMGIKEEERA
jgi:hypothetical protein